MTPLAQGLLFAATLFYAAAFIASLIFITRGEIGTFPLYTRRLLAAGLLMQLLFFILEAFQKNVLLPVVSFSGSISFFAFTIVVIYFVLGLRREIRTFGLIVTPTVVILLMMALFGYTGAVEPLTFQMTLPFWIHIVATFFSYGAFFVSFVSALFYLVQNRVLKSKNPGPLFYKLPSLETLQHIIQETMVGGFILLTVGILFAGLWLFRLTGLDTTWHGESKLILSFLVWAAYLVILIGKSLGYGRGKNAALLSLGAFSFAMVAFLGARLMGLFLG